MGLMFCSLGRDGVSCIQKLFKGNWSSLCLTFRHLKNRAREKMTFYRGNKIKKKSKMTKYDGNQN